MKVTEDRVVRLLTAAVLTAAISGCAPVTLVGGMMGNKSDVVIDETTVDPALRSYLPTTNRLAFVSQDATAIYAAEYVEMNSHYEVALVPPPEAASPSQVRRLMDDICAGDEQPDIILAFRRPQSDTGTGTTVRGVLTGRAKFDISLATDTLRCDNGARSQFMTTGQINQGIYNADQSKSDQILGQRFAIALLRLAGHNVAEE